MVNHRLGIGVHHDTESTQYAHNIDVRVRQELKD